MPLYQPLRHIVGHKPLIMAHLRVMRIVDRRDEIIPLACPLCRGRLQALKHIFDIRAVDLHKLRLHDIVGIICLVLMTLLGMPYPMLISVIIGVTNMIPVFGPYIGLIPSALLIVLVSPVQALYFIIMIAILMQVDGNLIGPAILGESTGLSAFWVLFSILFFGGIWGIVGMLIGVPLFAVIYRIIADSLNWKLRKKNLSTVTDSYRNLKEIRLDADGTPLYILYAPEDFEKPKKENPIKKMQQSAEKIKEKLSKKKEDSKKDSKKDDKKS